MNGSNENHIGIIILLFVILFSLPDKLPPETHTIYRLQCPDVEDTGSTCSQPRFPTSDTYRIFPDKNEVVNTVPWVYENCTIFDAKNWQCASEVERFVMRNGDKRTYPKSFNIEENAVYIDAERRSPQVPYWIWLPFKIYAFFRDLF